jgi:hypothetical protein
MAKPRRPRTDRRARQRELRKEIRATEKLATQAPGGARDRPITVVSASVVESIARSTPCVQCGGELSLKDHAAPTDGQGRLRLCHLVCKQCHAPRELWFSIETPLPS